MKRWVISLLIIALLVSPLVIAQEEKEQSDLVEKLKSIWGDVTWGDVTGPLTIVTDPLTDRIKTGAGYVNDKALWIIGAKNFKGEGTNLASREYWFKSRKFWYQGLFWYYGLYGLLLVFWLFWYYPHMTKEKYPDLVSFLYWHYPHIAKRVYPNSDHTGTATTYQIASNFGAFGPIKTYRNNITKFMGDFFILENWKILVLPIAVPFVMGIPYINRFLQIITLEIFGLNIFYSTFLIATLIAIITMSWKEIRTYYRRRRIYRDKMEEIEGEEVAKALAKA